MKTNKIIKIFLGISVFVFLSWVFFIAPQILKIKSSFNYKAEMISVDNFFDIYSNNFSGEQYSKTNFYYEVLSKEKNILKVKNVLDVKSFADKQIYFAEPIYEIDSISRKHISKKIDENYDAYLFSPNNLKVNDKFYFYHPGAIEPFLMEFEEEEYISGLKLYRYKSVNEKESDMSNTLSFLPDVPEQKGIKLKSGIRMWIEPVSGHLVNMEEFSIDYYYYDIKTGEKLYPYNNFLNTYTEQSILEHIEIAKDKKIIFIFVKYVIPIILFLVIIILYFLQTNFNKINIIYSKILNNKIEISILVLFISFSVISYQFLNNYFKNETRNLFEKQSTEISQLINNRIDNYKTILLGAKGLLDSSEIVNREEWKIYIDSLNIEEKFSGVQGIGYSKIIYPEEKEDFIENIKSEGFENFSITPPGEREVYTSIIYIEPFDEKNKRAFGYDMFSENVRNKAMSVARDTNEPVASGKVILMQEKEESEAQSGFLIYVPVYKNDSSINVIENRIKNISGYVFAPFRMNDLMNEILKNEKNDLNILIYDGLKPSEMNQMFNSNNSYNKESHNVIYRKKETIYVAGHPWSIEYVNKGDYKIGIINQILPKGVLFVGILLGILLSIIFKISRATKEKAVNLAKILTEDLEKKVIELNQAKSATLNILEDVDSEKQKLSDLTSRFELAKKSARIGIWEWDIPTNIIIWDENMYDLYEVDKKTFNISYDAWFKIIDSSDRKNIKDQLDNILKNKEKSFNFMFKIETPKKDFKYMHVFGTVVYDSNTNPVKVVGINLDVTKEKEIDRAKTEFVSLASHQLKTPIGAIKWSIEMLLDGDYGTVSDEQKAVMQEIDEMTNRMNSLVTDFLNISRIDLGTFAIETQKTSYIDICNNVLDELENKIKLKKHNIIKNYEENMPELLADPKLLHIIFQNLISNAVKYTQDNGEIKISIGTDDKKVNISVHNNGEGIPEKEQEKIFSKMFRASNAQSLDPDGNGLGLYLLKSIVETAGGKTWFESKKEEGTTFFVEFPLPGMKSKKI